MRHSKPLLALSLALPALLGGCGATDSPPADVAVYEPSGTGGNTALLEARLVRDDGGCYYVESPEGDRFLPVFPLGSVVQHEGGITFRGTDYAEGDLIALGGGASRADPEGDWVIPETCAGDVTWWIVSQVAE